MGVLLIVQNSNLVAAEKAKSKKMDHMKAYQMYQQKCLGCHDSVADPELPGRTRDDWHLVVNVMHGYGMDLSLEESEIIIDLLYDLRKGLERDPATTARAFVSLARQKLSPTAAGSFAAITESYLAERFGGHPTATVETELRALRNSLRT